MKTQEIIGKLKGLDLSKHPFNEIKTLINEFDSLKVVRLKLKPNTLITRVRRGRGYSRRKVWLLLTGFLIQSWNYNDTWLNENIDVAAHIGVNALAELEEIN